MTGETRGRSRAGARDQKLLISGLIRRLAVTSFELSDPAAGIKNLLLAGVEGVAVRADVDLQVLAHGRARLEGIAASAGNVDLGVFGMDGRFHGGTRGGKLVMSRVGRGV